MKAVRFGLAVGVLIVLAASAQAQGLRRAPLEMVLFHKPTCPQCQKIVKLVPQMRTYSPKLNILLHENETSQDLEYALNLNQGTKTEAEQWGAAFVIFTGPDWGTPDGKATLAKMHQLLSDRLSLKPIPWPPPDFTTGTNSSPLSSLKQSKWRDVVLAAWRRMAQKCTLFPLALMALFLLWLGQDPRRLRHGAYPFAAGAILVLLLLWTGILTALTTHLPYNWPKAATFGGLGLISALIAWRSFWEFRRLRKAEARQVIARALAAETGESPAAAEAAAKAPARGRPGWLAPLALLLGALSGLLNAQCTSDTLLPLLPTLVKMKAFTPASLERLGLYALLCALPFVVMAVVAAEVGGSRRSREWAEAHPADAKQAVMLGFIILTAALLGQIVAVTS